MIETLTYIWEHRNDPWYWIAIGALLVFIDRMGRRLINDQLKRLFRVSDKSEFKQYSNNQKVIMENQRRIMDHLGVPGCVESSDSKKSMEKNLSPYSGIFLARFAKSFIGGKKMKERLKSRKFWMAIVTAALIILNDGLDLGIDSETVYAFAGLVATWIIGQAAVDAKKEGKASERTNYAKADDLDA